jgi:hypothetical protein
MLEAVGDRLQEPLAGERLLDEVVDAEAHRFEGLAHRGLAGDDDGRRQALFVAELANEVDAVLSRETDVEQQQIGQLALLIENLQRRLDRIRRLHREPFLAQLPGDVGADLLVILDEEDEARLGRHGAVSSAGSVMRNVAPPSSEST